MMLNSKNLYVITLSSDIEKLVSLINNSKNEAIILSSHYLFDIEKEEITKKTEGKNIIFKTFADFISFDEMKFCDEKADEIVFEKYSKRDMTVLMEYYQNIKELKNKFILKNLKKEFEISEIYLLSEDLGIDKSVFEKEGATIFTNPVQTAIKENYPSKKLNVFEKLKKISKAYSIIYHNGQKILYGRGISRIKQYFRDDLKIRNLNFFESYAIYNVMKNRVHLKPFLNFDIVSTSPHAYKDEVYTLSQKLKLPFVFFQDGFLPNNYTSKYFFYYPKIDKYLTWNKFTEEYFEKMGIKAGYSSIYKDGKLPLIKEDYKIKNILVLASGSGDWTALKSRSDEDKMFEMFIKLAQNNPQFNIIYRPHPIWIHPEHQGVNSISRYVELVKKYNLQNLMISTNAKKESEDLTKNFTLSKQFTSTYDEIAWADTVVSDHSQTVLSAAKEGKFIFSTNGSNRESLFKCFGDFGFKIINNSEELQNFANSLQNNSEEIEKQNKAIMLYNESMEKYSE